jgi:hypothetical protein
MQRVDIRFMNDFVVEHEGKKYVMVELGAADDEVRRMEFPDGLTSYWPSVPTPKGYRGRHVACDRYGPIDVPLPEGEPFCLEDMALDRVIGGKTVREWLARR